MLDLILKYLRRGPSTSKEIQAATGLSQSTISRAIKSLGDHIVQISAGRYVRYAATCNAFNSDDKIPLRVVNKMGKTDLLAYLRPLVNGGFFVEPSGSIPPLLLGENRNGLYADLPFFLFDLRPQGFLGRQIARRIAEQCDEFPFNPKNWSSSHIGRYLLSNGEDLPGNFVLGDQIMLRLGQRPAGFTENDYPDLARKVMEGETPGSSAGGEQAKFAVFNSDLQAHVIVKFSSGDDNEVSERWRDILITEYYAAKMVDKYMVPTTMPRLIEKDNRLFLESLRFDRIGVFGRAPMMSLEAVASEYNSIMGGWPQIMEGLFKRKMILEKDLRLAQLLFYFGSLINNTDMHSGNLSLSIENEYLDLLPVYDMCSMGFAPNVNGEVQPFAFNTPDLQSSDKNKDLINMALKAAHDFWQNIADDERISDSFKAFLRQGNLVATA